MKLLQFWLIGLLLVMLEALQPNLLHALGHTGSQSGGSNVNISHTAPTISYTREKQLMQNIREGALYTMATMH